MGFDKSDQSEIWPPEIHRSPSQLERARAAVKLTEDTARLVRQANLALFLAFTSISAIVVFYGAMFLCSKFNDRTAWGQAIMGVLTCLISPITGIVAFFLGIRSWKMPQAKYAIFICCVVGLFYGGCWVASTIFASHRVW